MDPIFRTSDVLSALFHEVAIICEAESDARFYRFLLDSTTDKHEDADVRFFHFGGKAKLPIIAKALRSLGVPTIAIVDIDLLSDKTVFERLYTSLGSVSSNLREDITIVADFIDSSKLKISGSAIASALDSIAASLREKSDFPKEIQENIRNLIRSENAWSRLKLSGKKFLTTAPAFKAYEKIENAGDQVGLMLVGEGELEGFCRDISRSQKSEWLEEVLTRDFVNDTTLEDARIFAERLRQVIKNVTIYDI